MKIKRVTSSTQVTEGAALATVDKKGSLLANPYKGAQSYIQKAIDALSKSKDREARDAIANLSVIYFDLKSAQEKLTDK